MLKRYNLVTYDEHIKDTFRVYLHTRGIYCAVSGYFEGWYFDIECTETQAEIINNYLDTFDELED